MMSGYEDQLDVKIVDTVFDPNIYGVEFSPDGPDSRPLEVRYHKVEGASLYKVWVYLAGADLPRVETVTYQLHSTFDDPTRTVSRALNNQEFRIEIWTWGIFTIQATIGDRVGRTYAISHEMTYGKSLSSHSHSIKYIVDSPDSSTNAKLIA